MATSLAQAVKGRYDSADGLALRTALTGGLWYCEVPEAAELPYAWYVSRRSRFLHTTEAFHVEVALLDFHVYAAGAEACEALADTLRALYDWCTLDFAAPDSTLQVRPLDRSLSCEGARWKDHALVFRAQCGYEVWINRNETFTGA